MTPNIITAAWLRRQGARCHDLEVFEREWPDGCEVTQANLLHAAALSLDLHWFAQHWLPASLLAEYERQEASLRAEYQRQRASLRDQYEHQRAPLLAEYQRQRASLRDQYEHQRAPFWAEYQRQEAPLRAEYERQEASLWNQYERQETPFLAEYERQRAPLWAEYERQETPLWAEYERQREPLLAEYERQRASLRDQYEHQRAPLLAEYQRQRALEIARLAGLEGGGTIMIDTSPEPRLHVVEPAHGVYRVQDPDAIWPLTDVAVYCYDATSQMPARWRCEADQEAWAGHPCQHIQACQAQRAHEQPTGH